MVLKARHILWDWNGTLLDDVEACVEAINRMLDTRRLTRIDTSRYRDVFEFPVQNYYRSIGFDLPSEDWDAMAQEFHVHYHETSRDADLRPGCRSVLECLSREGVPMSVLSACEIGILQRMMRDQGIDRFFQKVSGLENLYAESKLEGGRRLIGELGEDPRHMVLVGDTTHDHEVASALDCACILVAGGHQSEHRLQACGCPVLPDMAAIHDGLMAWGAGKKMGDYEQ